MRLITGGSGFLGRGLMRCWGDEQCVVYSRDEYKQDLCKKKYPRAQYVLGDILDLDNLTKTIRKYSINTVIHTAAIKFIPEAEENTREAIRVNVQGSKIVFDACLAEDSVETVVAISTDKACSPLNVYGATKLLMERLIVEYSKLGDTLFTGTRYGNVIGSTGSVVPRFKQQLKDEGIVKITSSAMTRYWLSVSEAVDLIEVALISNSGDIVIPDPGAMVLLELALALTQDDISKVREIGLRPGEKLHENLLNEQEMSRSYYTGDGYILTPNYKSASACLVRELTSEKPAYWWDSEKFLEMVNESEQI